MKQSKHWAGVIWASSLGIALSAQTVYAQKPSAKTDRYYQDSSVPSHFVQQFRALGDRLKKPGKERITLDGTLADASGTSSVQLKFEKGQKFRIDVPGQASRSLAVDGKNISKTPNPSEERLIQGLFEDSADSLMESLAEGHSHRFIGRRYRATNGQLCDLYDVATPGKGTQPAVLIKRYCFDSNTQLLSYVEYPSSSSPSAPLIRTAFSDWRTVDGQAVPGRIQRTEGGVTAFTFQVVTASLGSRVDDATFSVTTR